MGSMACIMCHQPDGFLIQLIDGNFIHPLCGFHSLSCRSRGNGPLTLASYRPKLSFNLKKEFLKAHISDKICHICFTQGGVTERSFIERDKYVHAYCMAKQGFIPGDPYLAEFQADLVNSLVNDLTLSLSTMKSLHLSLIREVLNLERF